MSTTERGNSFRDTIDRVLAAAGFRVQTEVRLGHKKVDGRAIWARDEVAGDTIYAIEAKDYKGTLPLSECTAFVNDYSPLVQSGAVSHAWLISRGPISPDGRNAVDGSKGLRAMTFQELQRRLLLLDRYLRDLIAERDAQKLPDYYIRPETDRDQDLENHVRSWIEEDRPEPMFLLGGYGKGKSTFAMWLAASLAEAALADQSARAPLLVRLGEIVEEQSLEGLLGKVLAAGKHRVDNYHFGTVAELNRLGRFVVIYDGFDEMKHGMTLARFEQMIGELMRFDEGDARVLVLGRNTAFHDDVEFRAIIQGRQLTTSGREVPAQGRRAYRTATIRGFNTQESHDYVRRFFPIRAAEQHGDDFSREWCDQRLNDLLSGKFDDLLARPVHAQMLCEVAVHREFQLRAMTVFELYDTFVHYLLDREVRKKGRFDGFNSKVRREFNGSLAWWMWERGGASTTSIADVPMNLCHEATAEVAHSFGAESLKRELIQGCLVEKAGSTIFFDHRSLQEFLVAEHLIRTDLATDARQTRLGSVLPHITPEVADFLGFVDKRHPEFS